MEREFAHQFCPAVGVVGLIGALGQVFGEVDLLGGIGLQRVRIYAAGGSKDNFFDARLERLGENEPVEEKIRGGSRLMQIDVAAATVVGSQVKNGVDALHGRARYPGFAQVRLHELNLAGRQMTANILEPATGQVIDDTHLRATVDKPVCNARADERSSTGNQHAAAGPKSIFSHSCKTPSRMSTNISSCLAWSYSGAIARARRPISATRSG